MAIVANCQVSVTVSKDVTKSARKRKSSVHFRKFVECVEIPSRSSYSAEETRLTWYQPQDCADIRSRNDAVVQKISVIQHVYENDIYSVNSFGSNGSCEIINDNDDDDASCNADDDSYQEEELYSRGLEHKFPGQGSRLTNIRNAAIRAVLIEQNQQKKHRRHNAEFLAALCCEYTRPLQVLAQEVARRDEDEAKKIYHEDKHPPSKRDPRKRGVRFARKQFIRHIPHCSEYTEADKENLWYQKEEFAAMKKERKKTMKNLIARNYAETDEETNRGLEGLMGEGSKMRKRNKHMALHAVMDEQDRQDQEAYCCQKQIADVYRSCTAHCAVSARKMGVNDELVIRMYDLKERMDAAAKSQSQSRSSSSTPGSSPSSVAVSSEDLLLSPASRTAKNVARTKRALDSCSVDIITQPQPAAVNDIGDQRLARMA